MNPITHPIEPEELMAYLDGELEAERETVLTVHLVECHECQEVIGNLKGVSNALNMWRVDQNRVKMTIPIAKAAEDLQRSHHKKWSWAIWPVLTRQWVPVGLAAVAIAVYVGTVSLKGRFEPQYATSESARASQAVELIAPEDNASNPSPSGGGGGGDRDKLVASKRNSRPAGATGATNGYQIDIFPVSGPMIIRTAQLALITKDLENARDNVESILKRHRGYLADLKIGGSTGSGRSLTGTLRVPADQIDSTLTELKTLGRVESESQSGQDVTSQYVDLEARLTNARHTEQRLTDLLRNRTGKLSDVLEVEQEISRVRGEIEQMEAERKTMANQVSFATLNLTVTEDYKAQLQVVPPSTSTRLSNAAVEGYRTVVDGVLSLVLFLLTTGPSLLLWGVLLFLPARLVWIKVRRHVVE